MTCVLRYGVDSSVCLEIPPDVLVARCDAPRGAAIVDLASAVTAALDAPLDYPSLSRAVVPGDKVVLALAPGVPQTATIVAAIIEVLRAAHVEPADITVLRTRADVVTGDNDPLAKFSAREQIGLVTHDPSERRSLGYLAAAGDGSPIYINRAIHEADLVLPIGCLRLEESVDYFGINGGLFPAFSDTKTLDRYRTAKLLTSPTQRKRLRKQADKVGWLFGAQMTVQIVPGAAEAVLHVLAGNVESVLSRGKELCAQAWSYSVPRRASLVVAAIEGMSGQQTWDNVARALAAASRAVKDNGSIALCTDLAAEPGPALLQVGGAEDRSAALRQVSKDRPADALPARVLAESLERGKVYLMSRLDEATVEELGVAPVASAEQLSRLAARHDSCIVLANAQHALATPEDERESSAAPDR